MERKVVNDAIRRIIRDAVTDVGETKGIHLMDTSRVANEIISVVTDAIKENAAAAFERGIHAGQESI
jgi:predicted RNA methylase